MSTAVLAGLLIGASFGLAACDGTGENPSSLPSGRSSERSFERPASGAAQTETEAEPTETPEPERTTKPTPSPTSTPATRTLPTRTTEPAGTTTTTTEVAPAEPTQTTTAAQPTTPSVAAVASESGTWGPLAWLLLIAFIVALVIGGLFVYRSQRRSAWDTEARALESETRAVTATRLPPVLSTNNASQRGLAWPPVRTAMDDLVARWNALTERASGETRRNWSLRISGLLQELIVAVDSENEAMAVGNDWTLLRPRVTHTQNALASALAVQPRPEPPPAGEPGPHAYGT
ncbi:hypothetical protein HH310_26360 [Actinoplanes sp. TBRC 11911]|uniref:hypothetical protein n=1 Tax=Actinoplanes sp. TBRC 11911 TaxID=2729386 RepID=UPI00145DC461|nr:hypothetical protein [Actinoplanes sp. TBRC 11911]NMO54697.1 hypothetical protein [Actinoplanes sp. TBRC 11911]